MKISNLARLALAVSIMLSPVALPRDAGAVTINIHVGTSLNHGRGITCWEGERLLRNRGLRDIVRVDCRGRYFIYRAWRGGSRFEIGIRSRDGRVSSVRRISR